MTASERVPLVEALRLPQTWRLLILGFSAGLPLLLIFSSLSLWLREAGVERSAVTYFSWAALGYSFKFVWAPLVDQLPLPWLTRALGSRRSWLVLAQLGVATAIFLMGAINPAGDGLVWMALAAVLLGFSGATQDIVIDAYRIECAPPRYQALLSATYIVGYRLAMIVSGAGSLYLAAELGSATDHYDYRAWQMTYWVMAAVMGLCLLATLCMPEPQRHQPALRNKGSDYGRFLLLFVLATGAFASSFFYIGQSSLDLHALLGDNPLWRFLTEALRFFLAVGIAAVVVWIALLLNLVNKPLVDVTYVAPVRDFFTRYPIKTALLVLALIGLYRISDIVLGVISNVFYQDIGFSKKDIAAAVKAFGVVMSILGGLLGGALALRLGVMRILMLGAVLSALTNLLFIGLSLQSTIVDVLPINFGFEHDRLWSLYAVVALDNLAAGLASAAFVAFLSSLVNVSFTAMQYAIFSSMMMLVPKLLGGYSGGMVDQLGYPAFFVATTLMGLPVIALVWWAGRHLRIESPQPSEPNTL
ncbi:major facilitator superfamily MFS_1 [gamma proteobacterium HTCC5015]|nr:major facilitator superfamily MFS_1 [gamma proteobacterium HTCC5015]